jgi:hypothetical protein
VPRGDPVHGIGIVRYPDANLGQLVTESYRPRTGGPRRSRQLGDPLRQLLGPADERLPDPLVPSRVESGEDLAPEAVEDGQALPLLARLADPPPERVERADAGRREAERGAEAAGGRDPDPQPGEGAGPETDGDQVDRRPAAGRRGAALDLLEQGARVAGLPLRREPEPRLVQGLAVAPGAGGGVGGGGVEADYEQVAPALSP